MLFKCCCLFLLLSSTERITRVESSGEKNNKGSNLNVNNTKNSGYNKFGKTEKIMKTITQKSVMKVMDCMNLEK